MISNNRKGGTEMQNKIYYEIQTDWTKDEYYYLHRYLHRMLYYYNKFSEEISSLDLNKMSKETKVLMYCIIKYYNYDFLMERYDNLSKLFDIKPLENELILDDNPLPEDNIYKKMNVIY